MLNLTLPYISCLKSRSPFVDFLYLYSVKSQGSKRIELKNGFSSFLLVVLKTMIEKSKLE